MSTIVFYHLGPVNIKSPGSFFNSCDGVALSFDNKSPGSLASSSAVIFNNKSPGSLFNSCDGVALSFKNKSPGSLAIVLLKPAAVLEHSNALSLNL
jgi:hypothetical protein